MKRRRLRVRHRDIWSESASSVLATVQGRSDERADGRSPPRRQKEIVRLSRSGKVTERWAVGAEAMLAHHLIGGGH
jgi:hypothetical protein